MLADDVIAAVGGPWDRAWGGIISCAASMLATAQRFSVTQEVILSAEALAQRPLTEQLRAMAVCRLPTPRAWFEWRGDGDISRRCGVLVEIGEPDQPTVLPKAGNVDPRRGSIIAFDQLPSGFIVLGPMGAVFDWRELPGNLWLPGEGTQQRERIQEQLEESRAHYGWSDAEFAAARAFNSRHGLAPLTGTRDRLASVPPEQYRHFCQFVRRRTDLTRTLVLLLNSRNLVRVTSHRIDEKLQRARRRAGKAPLGEYSQIDIRLSRILAKRVGEASDPRNPQRFHVVRGHFKIRKTGVFWWSSHSRGELEAGQIKQQIRKIAA
jgi:hypothetical protein